MKRLIIFLCFWLLGYVGYVSAQNSWKQIWVPVTESFNGPVNDLAVATNGNVFAVGDSVYLSKDSGKTGVSVGGSGSNILRSGPGGTLYAGNYANHVGLYMLDSAAKNWQCLDSAHVVSFDVRADGKVIIVGSGISYGIRLSTDGGTSWNRINTLDSMYVSCVRIDSLGRLFVAGLQMDTTDNYLIERLFISTDNGSSWSRSQLPDTLVGITDMTFDGPSQIYLVNGADLLQSTDGGNSWAMIGAAFSGGQKITVWQGSLYMISNGVLRRSSDHGITWHILYPTNNVGVLKINQSGEMFIGTGNGLYYSTDAGTTWTKGLVLNTFIPAQAIATSLGGILLVGTNNGIYMSTDDGDQWRYSGLSGLNVYELGVNLADSAFAATTSGMYFANPPAPGWNPLGQDSLLLTNGQFALDSIGTIIFEAIDYSIPGTRVIKSTNGGMTWAPSFQMPHDLVRCLLATGGSHIYMAFDSLGIYRSTDRGDTWTTENNGLPWGGYELLAYNGKYLFCSHPYQNGDAVFRTKEDTINWVLTGLQKVDIRQLAVDPYGGLYAANFTDLFYSSDNGDTWRIIDSSAAFGNLSVLAIASDKFAYVLTTQGTILRTSSPLTSVKGAQERTPSEFQLLQNYPNPFNPSTTINYSLPVKTYITLKVYDVLGREVTTLVDGSQSAGSHVAVFNGGKLSSGVYFYRLKAGNFMQTRKLLLMK